LLFDLQRDISERRNVAKANPAVVEELRRLIDQHTAAMKPGPPQR
jgi:hypothetical protein